MTSTRYSFLLLTVLLTVFALAPLFYPGYIQTHAGFEPLWTLTALRANLGTLNGLPPFEPWRSAGLLPYYLVAGLPVAPPTAIKLLMGLGLLLASTGMFFWVRPWLNQEGAFVAAMVYVYLPFQLTTLYVRGAWAEALFWGLLPWAMSSATQLGNRFGRKLACATAILWLALGLTNLGLTMWAGALLAGWLLIFAGRRGLLPLLSAAGGLFGATISALLLPTTPPPLMPTFSDHLLYPAQLFIAAWGYGISRPGWDDGMSFQIGVAPVGLALLALILARTPRLIFLLLTALLFIIGQLTITAPMWQRTALSHTLTYPWQLMGFAGLTLAALAGATLKQDERLKRLPTLSAIVILIMLSSYRYLEPQFLKPTAVITHPTALLGAGQVALLQHNFTVQISGDTAGLERGETAIPLAEYGPLQPHNVLLLNVTWQPLHPLKNWKLFAHLVDANDAVITQFDGYPQTGHHPTVDWIPGELIADIYPLPLPPETPPGPYRIFLGLYNETTFERMPFSNDPEGRVILPVE